MLGVAAVNQRDRQLRTEVVRAVRREPCVAHRWLLLTRGVAVLRSRAVAQVKDLGVAPASDPSAR